MNKTYQRTFRGDYRFKKSRGYKTVYGRKDARKDGGGNGNLLP